MKRVLLALAIFLLVRFAGPRSRDGQGTVGQQQDRAALEALYTATNGSHWSENGGWLEGTAPSAHCAWFGVSCDAAGRVQKLLLPANNLSGPIPPELQRLHHLQTLRLNGNQLSGPIPPQLGQLPNLHSLRLQHNQLSGTIPAPLQNLRRLQDLNLHANQLTCWQTPALLRWAIAVPSADWNHPQPGRLLCSTLAAAEPAPTPHVCAGNEIPVEALTSLLSDD